MGKEIDREDKTMTTTEFIKLVELFEAKAWQGKDVSGKQFHYLEGYASDTSLDRDGDRMAPSALKSMLKGIESGMNLYQDHEHNLSNTLGVIMKGEIRGDRLWIQCRLEDPTVNSNVKSLLNKMDTGVKVGLSIGGDMTSHHFEQDNNLNKRVRVIDDVQLYEISAVGLPSNENAFVYGSMFKRKRISEAEYKHQIRNEMVEELTKLLQGADAGQHPDQQGMSIHSHVHSHPPGQGHTEPLNHPHSHPIGTPHPSPIDHIGAMDMEGNPAPHEEGTPAVGTPGLSPPTMMENVPGVGQPTVGSGLPSTAYRATPTTLVDGPLTTGQGAGTPGQGSGLPANAPKTEGGPGSGPQGGQWKNVTNRPIRTHADAWDAHPENRARILRMIGGAPGGEWQNYSYGQLSSDLKGRISALGPVKQEDQAAFAMRPGGAMGVKDLKLLVALQKKYPSEQLQIFVAKQSDPNDWYFAQSLDNWGDDSTTQPDIATSSEQDVNVYGTSTADQENSDQSFSPDDVQSPEWIDLSFRTRKSQSRPKGQNRGQNVLPRKS